MRKTLPVLPLLLFLAGCPGPLTRSVVEPPRLAKIPLSLKERCPLPVELPDRALSASESARLWGEDRANLGDCGERHSALVAAATAVEEQGKHAERGAE